MFKSLVLEAFANKDVERANEIIVKKISKQSNEKFYSVDIEEFTNAKGEFVGHLYATDDEDLIRFNWKKHGNKDSSNLASIDIFTPENKETAKFHLSLYGFNALQLISEISDFIDNPKMGEIDVENPEAILTESCGCQNKKDFTTFLKVEEEEPEEVLEEAKTTYKGMTWKSNGPAITALTNIHELGRDEVAEIVGVTPDVVDRVLKQKLEVTPGIPEQVKMSAAEKKAAKDLDGVKWADPKIIFEDMSDLIDMVISGINPSLLITGNPGTGKSFTLDQQLKEKGMTNKEDYVIVKGKATPKALYGELFLNNGKLIVFDDADSVFNNEDSVNILKGALDSSPIRSISWKSSQTYDPSLFELDGQPGVYDLDAMHSKAINEGKFPNEFEFDGRVIFISNIPGHKMDSAIKSRSFNIDVMIKAEDLLNRMETILDKVDPDLRITSEERKETLDLLKKTIVEDSSKQVTLRTLGKALKLRASGSQNWERLVKNYA